MIIRIRITTDIEFKCYTGNIIKTYAPGDLVEATHDMTDRGYWVTSMGGIFYSEAEAV